jgi:NADPH:quinone reductase-like Zn-dependent oxidoreductase
MKLRRRVLRWSAAALSTALVAGALTAYWTSDNNCDDLANVPGRPMKAIIYCDYGSADVLQFRDVEKPVPSDDEVLVRVRAASVNPYDWHMMRGTPYAARVAIGLRKPADIRMGVDFAGTVDSVGKNVTDLEAGDDVFGARTGALAEYIAVPPSRLALKPTNVTFEQAATVGVAAVTALQGLRDKGQVRPGQKVLINGASGGVGTFAVQIAKSFGAEVTGVCSTRNLELVRSIGADHVIDYTRQDFTADEGRYDVMIDNVGNRSLSESRRILKPDGRYVLIGGGGPDDGRWLGPLPRVVNTMVMSRFVSQEMGMFMANVNSADLNVLRSLLQAGTITPIIDRRYTLQEAAEAIRYLEQGRARGKVVVTVEQTEDSGGEDPPETPRGG